MAKSWNGTQVPIAGKWLPCKLNHFCIVRALQKKNFVLIVKVNLGDKWQLPDIYIYTKWQLTL